jgi:hypothetical protein
VYLSLLVLLIQLPTPRLILSCFSWAIDLLCALWQVVPSAAPALHMLDMLGLSRPEVYKHVFEDMRRQLESKHRQKNNKPSEPVAAYLFLSY